MIYYMDKIMMNKIILFLIFSLLLSFRFVEADNVFSNKNYSELNACVKGNIANSKNGFLNKISDYISVYNFCSNRDKFDDLEEKLLLFY